MAQIIVVGFAPMPLEKLRMNGPSLRTWHFLKCLLAAGHHVCLFANRGHDVYPVDLPPIVTQTLGKWTYHNVSDEVWWTANSTVKTLIAGTGNLDCIIGVTTPGTAIAAGLAGDLPLWGDMYGSLMAEAQMKALVYDDDSYLPHFFRLEHAALRRSDKFSVVSERQRWALVGELGLLGRLNKWTSGYDFVTSIPIASETEPFEAGPKLLRGKVVPEDAFVILYTGGYNTWCDVQTLFQALEIVMEQLSNAYFVSTGGLLIGHDEKTYKEFQSLIETSEFYTRYKLQGWIPPELLPSYYLESNLAVNVDRLSYEAMLGSRTRVMDWLRAGLPCILSDLPELASDVTAHSAGLVYTPGSCRQLADHILTCATQPERTAAMGRCAQLLLFKKFSMEATAHSLLSWAERPSHAPDFQKVVPAVFSAAVEAAPQGHTLAKTSIMHRLSKIRYDLSNVVRRFSGQG